MGKAIRRYFLFFCALSLAPSVAGASGDPEECQRQLRPYLMEYPAALQALMDRFRGKTPIDLHEQAARRLHRILKRRNFALSSTVSLTPDELSHRVQIAPQTGAGAHRIGTLARMLADHGTPLVFDTITLEPDEGAAVYFLHPKAVALPWSELLS